MPMALLTFSIVLSDTVVIFLINRILDTVYSCSAKAVEGIANPSTSTCVGMSFLDLDEVISATIVLGAVFIPYIVLNY